MQGVGDAKAHAMRQFSDRVIDYDVYNDLGHLPLDAKKDTFSVRPILGGGAAVEVRPHVQNSYTMLNQLLIE